MDTFVHDGKVYVTSTSSGAGWKDEYTAYIAPGAETTISLPWPPFNPPIGTEEGKEGGAGPVGCQDDTGSGEGRSGQGARNNRESAFHSGEPRREQKAWGVEDRFLVKREALERIYEELKPHLETAIVRA